MSGLKHCRRGLGIFCLGALILTAAAPRVHAAPLDDATRELLQTIVQKQQENRAAIENMTMTGRITVSRMIGDRSRSEEEMQFDHRRLGERLRLDVRYVRAEGSLMAWKRPGAERRLAMDGKHTLHRDVGADIAGVLDRDRYAAMEDLWRLDIISKWHADGRTHWQHLERLLLGRPLEDHETVSVMRFERAGSQLIHVSYYAAEGTNIYSSDWYFNASRGHEVVEVRSSTERDGQPN